MKFRKNKHVEWHLVRRLNGAWDFWDGPFPTVHAARRKLIESYDPKEWRLVQAQYTLLAKVRT